jgi:hypothetical protein
VTNTVRSESRCALRLRYVDLVVSIEVVVEVCCVLLYSVVKQQLKCNTSKVCNCLIQFLLTMVLSHEENFHKCTATFLTHCMRKCGAKNVLHKPNKN